jgi:hypothetical protein
MKQQARKGRSLQPLELNISSASGYIPHAPPKRGYSPDLESTSRKLEQLEAENTQLKKLLEEAELSIAGYKRFLAAKNSMNYRSVCIQTEVIAETESHQGDDSSINSHLRRQNESLVVETFNLKSALRELNDQHNKLKAEFETRIRQIKDGLKRRTLNRKFLEKSNHTALTTLVASDLNQFQTFLCHSFAILLKHVSQSPSTRTAQYADRGTDPIHFTSNEVQSFTPNKYLSSSTNTNIPEMISSSSQTVCDFAISFSPRIVSLEKQLNGLSHAAEQMIIKFGGEINAIKHLSHCKDLVRVASLRELGLEKDRLMNDLKYSKEIQGVLWFCVETSEKMLREINPQIVLKLQESRHKRMLILERDVSEKRRDIEQRSMETCTVNVNHLETFQLKAEMRCKTAATESQNSLIDLQKLLQGISSDSIQK